MNLKMRPSKYKNINNKEKIWKRVKKFTDKKNENEMDITLLSTVLNTKGTEGKWL